MIGCPHFFDSASATTPARRSLPPPAGNGTASFTGRDGKVCAAADRANITAQTTAVSAIMIFLIGVSPPETSGIGRIAHETRLAESAVQAIPAAEGAGAALYLVDR